jgi:hypothetical protein
MSRYERKVFFERLVAMRDAYRVETHAGLDMTMADAMAGAQRLISEAIAAEASLARAPKPAAGKQQA